MCWSDVTGRTREYATDRRPRKKIAVPFKAGRARPKPDAALPSHPGAPMRKAILFTFAAAALAGCDFSGGSDAVAPISTLKASNLPAATGPSADLFFEVQDATGRSYFRSAVQQGASTADFEVAMPAGFAIPSPAARMYIAVYDFENTTIESDLLARSTGFTVDNLTAAPLMLEDEPFLTAGPSDATFTVTRSGAAQ